MTEPELHAELDGMRARISKLESENEHLRNALITRIVIEQAKGMLIERFDVPPDSAFELLRGTARRSGVTVQAVAVEILETRVTPDYIETQIAHLRRPK